MRASACLPAGREKKDMLELKLIDRGFAKTMLLLPGWATDYRIFSTLELNYNYLLPQKFSLDDFSQVLSAQLDKIALKKVSLFGCSLGAFLAAEFSARYPRRVEELFLSGVRISYSREVVEAARRKLQKDQQGFLRRFYQSCFSRHDAQSLKWFKQNLLDDYLRSFTLAELTRGLDYLQAAVIDPGKLAGIKKLRIFHGRLDRIAPLEEAARIKSCLPGAEFISLPAAGHIVFLNPGFREKFNG
ncbi:MAG: alpha/beta fold hydrolase [Candidatus Omnitrophota bacterium]|nr:alpha/beta fold hydrolase [Candidatus Omnitrophota bacterium]